PELDPPTYAYNKATETYQRWECLNFTQSALQTWGITKLRYGRENKDVVPDPSDPTTSVLRVIYPKGSRNPTHHPLGGTGFDAKPISVADGIGQTVRLNYQVYFPEDFDFVHGGKLPGIYGGHTSCSGGKSAQDCFSARFMWRKEGLGEIYLYVPKTALHQPSFCKIAPLSVCNQKYGFSIGRGSFRFKKGAWNKVSVAVRMNQVPSEPTGQLRVWYNDEIVIDYDQMVWRVNDTVGYAGIDFETFFGGSSNRFNTPIDTFSLFKD
ncbi:hypothetical protein K493DRAFT_147411, partial [Basidiobolus meristosporus CBS 931.73]